MTNDHDWFDEAPCKGSPAYVFFPDVSPSLGSLKHRDSRYLARHLAPARAICDECPFRDDECLTYALEQPYAYMHEISIIAGRTPREVHEYRLQHGMNVPVSDFRLADVEETVRLYNRAVEVGSTRPMLDVAEALGIDHRAARRRVREARRRGLRVLESATNRSSVVRASG